MELILCIIIYYGCELYKKHSKSYQAKYGKYRGSEETVIFMADGDLGKQNSVQDLDSDDPLLNGDDGGPDW